MGQSCIVRGCNSYRKPKGTVSFFRFPNVRGINVELNELAKRRRAAWCEILKSPNYTEERLSTKRICSLHFVNGKPAKLEDTEDPDWIPTIDIPVLIEVVPSLPFDDELLTDSKQTSDRINELLQQPDDVHESETHTLSIPFLDNLSEHSENEPAIDELQQQTDEVYELSNHESVDTSSTNAAKRKIPKNHTSKSIRFPLLPPQTNIQNKMART